MPTAAEMHTLVTETLIDALGVDEEEVKDEALLVEDLGAESIDFLDTFYRLEKNMRRKNWLPADKQMWIRESTFPDPAQLLGGLQDTYQYVVEETKRLNDSGQKLMHDSLPHMDPSHFLFYESNWHHRPTVADLKRYIYWIIDPNCPEGRFQPSP